MYTGHLYKSTVMLSIASIGLTYQSLFVAYFLFYKNHWVCKIYTSNKLAMSTVI